MTAFLGGAKVMILIIRWWLLVISFFNA